MSYGSHLSEVEALSLGSPGSHQVLTQGSRGTRPSSWLRDICCLPDVGTAQQHGQNRVGPQPEVQLRPGPGLCSLSLVQVLSRPAITLGGHQGHASSHPGLRAPVCRHVHAPASTAPGAPAPESKHLHQGSSS